MNSVGGCATVMPIAGSMKIITRIEAVVLNAVAAKGRAPSYGLGLVENSRGAIKHGSVYIMLARLEGKGFVSSRLERLPPGHVGRPARRLYRITEIGRRVLRAHNRNATNEP